MRMAATHRACRHVVQIVDAPDWERDMPIPLDESQITPIIGNLGKMDDMNTFPSHFHASVDSIAPSVGIDNSN